MKREANRHSGPPIGHVLHVTLARGGGVEAAIKSYRHGTRQWRHSLISPDPGSDAHGEWADSIQLVRRLARTLKSDSVDILHVHSSKAGAVVRSLPMALPPIVYSPHCYAFERRDVPLAIRKVYRLTERVLGRRTAAYGAVSPREMALTSEIAPDVPAVLVPNTSCLRPLDGPPVGPRGGVLRVVGVGRIARQKNPSLFGAIALTARARSDRIQFVWIGQGDPLMEGELRKRGVAITGWLDNDELERELQRSQVLLHTAAWEGCPIAFADATGSSLVIVASEAPYLQGLEGVVKFTGASQAVDVLVGLLDEAAWINALGDQQQLGLSFAASNQGSALARLYGAAMTL